MNHLRVSFCVCSTFCWENVPTFVAALNSCSKSILSWMSFGHGMFSYSRVTEAHKCSSTTEWNMLIFSFFHLSGIHTTGKMFIDATARRLFLPRALMCVASVTTATTVTKQKKGKIKPNSRRKTGKQRQSDAIKCSSFIEIISSSSPFSRVDAFRYYFSLLFCCKKCAATRRLLRLNSVHSQRSAIRKSTKSDSKVVANLEMLKWKTLSKHTENMRFSANRFLLYFAPPAHGN